MTEILSRRRTLLAPGAVVLGLALLTSGCAGNSANVANPDQYDTYDTNHDNNLTQEEWDRGTGAWIPMATAWSRTTNSTPRLLAADASRCC